MNKSKYRIKVALLSNDSYGNGFDNLEGANYITEQLCHYFEAIVTNSAEDIIFLKDINYTDAVKKLNCFIEKTGKQDNCIFIFYFCGHGKEIMREGFHLALALKDTDVNDCEDVGIKFNSLVDKIKKSNIKRFICIIDSCASGIINSMGDNKSSIKVDDSVEGSVYISSVNGTFNSYEVEVGERKIPWFSYCFWRALTTLNDKKKLYYSINDIFEETKKLMLERIDLNMEPGNTYRSKLYNEEIFPKINKKSYTYDTLEVIDWRITSICDNKCPICYACGNEEVLNGEEDLTDEQIDKIINKLSQISCKSICISGGEPTESKHLEKILRGLCESGFSIFLSTNGYKFMEYRENIEPYIAKLSLPLDGYDEKSNIQNGRNKESFSHVREILEHYNVHKPDFPIKISTVLTRKTYETNHLSKILDFLKNYNVSIWKIYEFIPENRGAKNKNSYSISKARVREVQKWVDEKCNECKFKIEFVKRENRNAAYFIIQSNGDVIIPIEDNKTGNVIEKNIGNILNNDIDNIIDKWNNDVNMENYFSNIKTRKIKQSYVLKPSEKRLLYNIISWDDIPSVEELSNRLREEQEDVKNQINMMYEHRIIKNIIPIVNLKLFGIKTFLATLRFSKYVNYPEGHLEEYLCYNAHIGWVTKCEDNKFRIAIFAKEQMDARNILEKIRKDLNCELEYDIHDLRCSFAIGEKNLFLNIENDGFSPIENIKYNSNEQKVSKEIKLTYEEFYALRQIENLRKPLKEDVDKKSFFKTCIGINESIISLKKKDVIEQLLVILDTRLLGYDWYIIFVQIDNDKIDSLIEFLRSEFNNITHINVLMPSNSQWNLDFELHVLSKAELDIILGQIERKFDSIKTRSILKIIRECKFSFLTHSVSDIILNNYVLKNCEDSES